MGDISGNVQRFSGFAQVYNSVRPHPPAVLIDVLASIGGFARPALVVDIGSGTGISTRIWAERADRIIGIEPNADMRKQAVAATAAHNIEYIEGLSSDTGLDDACADVVTCAQALHWMEPGPTFAEIARILRPGGVFAAYDCDWPPVLHWQVQSAYEDCLCSAENIERRNKLSPHVRYWDKHGHAARMAESGCFTFVRDFALHSVEEGNAERLIGIALSQGGVQTVLKSGFSESDIGVPALRAIAKRILGDTPSTWYLTYRVRLGIK
ncbi:MAG: class I SAM-dependent methyltransferase [Planctomycetes bacterium]|nr:class I SAM-dependent methyltransferase [Planctomycetota bacterium]